VTILGAWCLDFGHILSVVWHGIIFYLQGQHRLVSDVSMEGDRKGKRNKKHKKDQGHKLNIEGIEIALIDDFLQKVEVDGFFVMTCSLSDCLLISKVTVTNSLRERNIS
jgi:hypothetical protein